jgi:branched-subunit amino acid permease
MFDLERTRLLSRTVSYFAALISILYVIIATLYEITNLIPLFYTIPLYQISLIWLISYYLMACFKYFISFTL